MARWLVALTVISILVSVAATWTVAHIYYRRATKDLHGVVDKLPASVAEKLMHEQRRRLTLDELEELVRAADAYPTEFGLFPYKCPRCGSPTEVRGAGPTEYSDAEAWPICPACGWRG